MMLERIIGGAMSALLSAQTIYNPPHDREIYPIPIESSVSENNSSITGRFLIGDGTNSEVEITYSDGIIYVKFDKLEDYIRQDKIDVGSLSGFGVLTLMNPASPQHFNDHIYFVAKPNALLRNLSDGDIIFDIDSINGVMYLSEVNDIDGDGKVRISENLTYDISSGNFEDSSAIPSISAIVVDGQAGINRIFTVYPGLLEERLKSNDTDMNRFMKDTAVEWGIFSEYELSLLGAVHDKIIEKYKSYVIPEITLTPVQEPKEPVEEKRWYKNPVVWVGAGGVVAGGIVATLLLSKDDESRRDKNLGRRTDIVPTVGVQDVGGF